MNPFQSTYRDEFQLAVVILLCILSWYRGGGPERTSALTMFAMIVADRIHRALFDTASDLWSTDLWYFSLDTAVLVAFLALALRANRLYPMALAAFQLVAVCAHLVRGMVDSVSPIAYFVMAVAPSYFQLIIIGFGLWAHRRRVRRFGDYRDWRLQSVQV